jgi:hypothetical protein
MPTFESIKPFTRDANYRVNIGWSYLEKWIESQNEGPLCQINLDPDFQRAHVWDEQKQIRYVEYRLRMGMSGRDIYWNHPTWQNFKNQKTPFDSELVLVDGKQRIEAVRRFMRNEIKAFGYLFNQYTDKLRMIGVDFVMHVNDLRTRAEVLQWYIDINAGGVAHTEEEINKVKALLEAEQKKI